MENVLSANFQSNVQTREHKEEKSHKGRSVNYFLWAYVAIFSAIMVIVMVEEKFFIK